MRSILTFALTLSVLTLIGCQAPTRPTPPEAAVAEPRGTEPKPVVANAAEKAAPEPATVEAAPVPQTPTPLIGKDVYERLVARFADPPCTKDRVVQRWERTYGRWPPRFQAQLEAILPLMAMTLDELETHHLPGEFALLPIVESWYRPDAGTPRSAYGMWQFTTATARHHGLRIVPGFDERLAPRASTRAAMSYLASLQNRFGNWKLANMAFNAGEYRVAKVLTRSKNDARAPSAASHLPAGLSLTTYEHLAKVQALACLIAEPQRFGIQLPLTTRVEPLQATSLPHGVTSLDVLAQRAGIDLATLRRLNPAFLQGRVVADARRELLLPRPEAKKLGQLRPDDLRRDGSVPSNVARVAPAPGRQYRVKRGDTLSAIAQRHGIRLRDLLNWNRLDVRALLHPGQMLRLGESEASETR